MNEKTISEAIQETANNTREFMYALAAHIEKLESKISQLQTSLTKLQEAEIDDHK